MKRCWSVSAYGRWSHGVSTPLPYTYGLVSLFFLMCMDFDSCCYGSLVLYDTLQTYICVTDDVS